jgi:hypothetical protein
VEEYRPGIFRKIWPLGRGRRSLNQALATATEDVEVGLVHRDVDIVLGAAYRCGATLSPTDPAISQVHPNRM